MRELYQTLKDLLHFDRLFSSVLYLDDSRIKMTTYKSREYLLGIQSLPRLLLRIQFVQVVERSSCVALVQVTQVVEKEVGLQGRVEVDSER